ncbi:MAG: hypothetical protein KBT01_08825, partial [Clostridiales bacterium]|nr:hypothetical protein [Candidatus Blautia equi]
GIPQQGAPTRPRMPQQGAPSRPGMPQQGGAPSRPGMPQQGAPARPGMPQHNVPQHGGPARPGMPQQGVPMPQPQAQQAPAAASVSNQVISSYMPDPMSHADYARFYQMGEEIRSILLGVQEDVRSEMAAANEVPQAVTCPWCGATTIPTANGTCEYCGGSVR